MATNMYDWTTTTRRLGSVVKDHNGYGRRLVKCEFCGRRGLEDDPANRAVIHSVTLKDVSIFHEVQEDKCHDRSYVDLRCFMGRVREAGEEVLKRDREEAMRLLREARAHGEWSLAVTAWAALSAWKERRVAR